MDLCRLWRLSAALAAAFLLLGQAAWAQAITQSGPILNGGGHAPMYLGGATGSSLASVMDSGPASGAANGFGLSELLLQQRAAGTGPYGTNDCDWSTYATNPAGAQYICRGFINGIPLFATNQPSLDMIIGGQTYSFPSVLGAAGSPPFGVNVAAYGAVPGTADNTATIQAAINSLSATGGTVVFPPGTYCTKTGPLTLSTNGVIFLGEGSAGQTGSAGGTTLSACGNDVAILNISGQYPLIQNINFIGSPVPTTTNDVITTTAVGLTTSNISVTGGRFGINAKNSYEVWLLNNTRVNNTYGTAQVYLTGAGGYILNDKFDQAYPFATPASGSIPFPAASWASSTAYNAGAIVNSGGWLLQAMNAGTSGGTAPAPPSYGSSTVDGGISWGLIGRSTHYGVQCDTGCGANLFIQNNDFSADETAGIGITNTLSGAAPSGVYIGPGNTFGANLYSGISAIAGFGITIHDNSFGYVAATGGSGISFVATGDDNLVSGNIMEVGGPSSGETCIFLDANNVNIENNECSATTGISVAAGVTDFNIIGNTWFSGFGATITGVNIAVGASDYYNIIGNNGHGTTTSVFDGGTGIHKMVLDSVFSGTFSTTFQQHLTVQNPKTTYASGFGSGVNVVGSDLAGTINVGTSPGHGGVINFGHTWTNPPACWAQDTDSPVWTKVSASTTQLTFSTDNVPTNWTNNDFINYGCGPGY